MTKKENYEVRGEEVLKKVKELIAEGNVRRIIIKDKKDKVLVEFPLTIGVVGAVELIPCIRNCHGTKLNAVIGERAVLPLPIEIGNVNRVPRILRWRWKRGDLCCLRTICPPEPLTISSGTLQPPIPGLRNPIEKHGCIPYTASRGTIELEMCRDDIGGQIDETKTKKRIIQIAPPSNDEKVVV